MKINKNYFFQATIAIVCDWTISHYFQMVISQAIARFK